MKTIVGISSINNIETIINSKIDEFFLGYIPLEWFIKFGFEISINRRYKFNQQFISKTIFENTINKLKIKNKKIFITINEQFYTNIQLEILKKYIKYIENLKIDGIIIADVFLLKLLEELKFTKDVHISGDMGIYNIGSFEYIIKNHTNLKIKRLIFPREMKIIEMQKIIEYINKNKLNIETEAFILGDPCIFNGASCRASHGYGLDGLCYTLKYNNSDYSNKSNNKINIGGKKCGICFINKLNHIGVKILKIPGRGNNYKNEIDDIIDIINGDKNDIEVKNNIIKKYGIEYCNGTNCYY